MSRSARPACAYRGPVFGSGTTIVLLSLVEASVAGVVPAAAAPNAATAANTRVTTTTAAEINTLTVNDEDFYSIGRDHLFGNNTNCTLMYDPGAPAMKEALSQISTACTCDVGHDNRPQE